MGRAAGCCEYCFTAAFGALSGAAGRLGIGGLPTCGPTAMGMVLAVAWRAGWLTGSITGADIIGGTA